MARKLPHLLAAVATLALLAAPSAQAVGVAKHRAVGTLAKAARASSPLVAPDAACPDQDDAAASAAAQEQAMLCMTDYARRAAGLPSLAERPLLAASAFAKAGDVIECDEFSHSACERDFTYWVSAGGYLDASCWRVGENLAWGENEYATVGSIFRAWMRSPPHRANILGDFAEVGVSVRAGNLNGHPAAHVWVQHFGSHC